MKKRAIYLNLAAGLVVLSALLLAACNSPLAPPANSKVTGSLYVSLTNNINTRTLAPPIDMTAATYTVTGTGPNGASFTATSTGDPVTKTGLVVGIWTIAVSASNSTADSIGFGSADATVTTGATTDVTVNVIPISGTGTLDLAASWPAADVPLPTIAASLTPVLGAVQPLTFVISGATASYTNASVPNGYYTLAFSLLSNGVKVGGAAETVRIVTGQTTSGTYAFTNVNNPGGTLTVTINTNLQNPLLVDLAGGQATMSEGSTQTITASVSNYSGSLVYAWYVNGAVQSAATTSSFTFGSGIGTGYYQIDAVAYTADGTQAGSATQSVQVQTAVVVVGPAMIDLASAGNYAILSEAGISTTGTTAITGDIGVSPIAATAITGFGLLTPSSDGTYSTSSLVTGNVYAATYADPTPATLATAVTAMEAAYTDAAGQTTTDASFLNLGAGTLGGNTLPPGVYTWGSAVGITSDITISGNSTDVWIFQVAGTLDVSSGVIVTLAGGALPQNIFWQVSGAATLGTTAQMKGIILDATAITMNTGATITGRLLSQTAVALDANTVTQP